MLTDSQWTELVEIAQAGDRARCASLIDAIILQDRQQRAAEREQALRQQRQNGPRWIPEQF
jgi:hypothetical protein